MRPVSVDQELARPEAPILQRGQRIRGYFDGHGLYRSTGGSIRRTPDGMLELRRPVGLMGTEKERLPVDSVRTLITGRAPWPFRS
jgi:hypothetical protein